VGIINANATLVAGSSIAAAASVEHGAHASPTGASSVVASANLKAVASANLMGGAAVSATATVFLGFAGPVTFTIPARIVQTGRVLFDQVDVFSNNNITRTQGVASTDLGVRLYFNGVQVVWPVVSGFNVPDVQLVSGNVYWTEFEAGYYSVRFLPNAVGFWRLLLSWASGNRIFSLSYDVQPQTGLPDGIGLRSSFIRGVGP
jgi:hypothetical protein